MHANHALGVACARGDGGDRQRGGVARKHALFVNDLRQAPIQLMLYVKSLRGSLDYKLALGKRVEVVCRLQASGGLFGLLGRQLALGGFLLQAGMHALHSTRQRLGKRIMQ